MDTVKVISTATRQARGGSVVIDTFYRGDNGYFRKSEHTGGDGSRIEWYTPITEIEVRRWLIKDKNKLWE